MAALLVCFPGSWVGNGLTRSVGVIICCKAPWVVVSMRYVRYINPTIIIIIIVQVKKYQVVCPFVWLSVCVSVCSHLNAKNKGLILIKLSKNGSLCVSLGKFEFQLISTMSDYLGNYSRVVPLYRASSETIIIFGSKWHERHSCFFDSSLMYKNWRFPSNHRKNLGRMKTMAKTL